MREYWKIGIIREDGSFHIYNEQYYSEESCIREIRRLMDLQFKNNEYTVLKVYKKD